MASSDSKDLTDDSAARQAAEVAVQLSEGPLPEDPVSDDSATGETAEAEEAAPADAGRKPARRGRPLTRGLHSVADRTTAAVSSTAAKAGNAAAKAGHAAAKTGNAAARTGQGAVSGAASAARRSAVTARHGAGSARRTAGSAGRGLSSGMNWLTAQVLAMGPRLRIRDQATLRGQFPGSTDDEIAERLIERAARAAAAVGGTTGAWAALPVVPAFPAEVAAETLAVVGIEVKLIAELHEVYGMGASGTGPERARAYLASWASRRGVYGVDGGLLLVAGSPLAKQLTRRLAARVRRSTFSLSPLLTGAVAGALINRRETRKLGRQMRDELRQQRRTYTATIIK